MRFVRRWAVVGSLTVLALAVPGARASTGDIGTVAGTGVAGFSGDGGSALQATLTSPQEIAPTADGGYLIADSGNLRVRKVLNGRITTVAGNGTYGYSGDGGPATAAEFKSVDAVAVTPDGGFLVADQMSNTIRKVLNGTITTVAGDGTGGFTGDGGPATVAKLHFPTGVAATPDGGFLIADYANYRIRKVAPDGTISTVAGTGTQGFTGDGGPATSAQLAHPVAVAAMADGGFLLADSDNNRIREVRNGTITTVAGNGAGGYSGDGGPATAAALFLPQGVTATPDGGFLIADYGNNRIRKVLNGTIGTLAGTGSTGFGGDGGPAVSAPLTFPYGATETSGGDYLIADSGNNRIRRVEGLAAPTVQNTDPLSPANQNTVKVFGTADAGSTVTLYPDSACAGGSLASGPAPQFAASGLSVSVADNSTTTFFARATEGVYVSACSTSSVSYTELTPPNTKLGKVKIRQRKRKATFRFSSTEKGSTFQCRLDRQKKFSKCRSPKTYRHLKPGKHTFRVRALHGAGNFDRTPAKRVFRIAR